VINVIGELNERDIVCGNLVSNLQNVTQVKSMPLCLVNLCCVRLIIMSLLSI